MLFFVVLVPFISKKMKLNIDTFGVVFITCQR